MSHREEPKQTHIRVSMPSFSGNKSSTPGMSNSDLGMENLAKVHKSSFVFTSVRENIPVSSDTLLQIIHSLSRLRHSM